MGNGKLVLQDLLILFLQPVQCNTSPKPELAHTIKKQP